MTGARRSGGAPASRDAVYWLSLAATPAFALAGLLGAGGPADVLCSAPFGIGVGGMTSMYAMMAFFHAGPWIKLLTNR